MEFLNRGGTLVSFDPDFLSFNIDGSAVPERTALLGTELSPRTLQMLTLQYGDQTLPVYKIAHLPGAYAGTFMPVTSGSPCRQSHSCHIFRTMDARL